MHENGCAGNKGGVYRDRILDIPGGGARASKGGFYGHHKRVYWYPCHIYRKEHTFFLSRRLQKLRWEKKNKEEKLNVSNSQHQNEYSTILTVNNKIIHYGFPATAAGSSLAGKYHAATAMITYNVINITPSIQCDLPSAIK